jgi:hypothetical protein
VKYVFHTRWAGNFAITSGQVLVYRKLFDTEKED